MHQPDPERLRPGRPVLVTGSNRSGTTWVGEVLCQSAELGYLHEPFNPTRWPRLLGTRLGGHYTYVPPNSSPPIDHEFEALLAYRFPWRPQLGELRTVKDGVRLLRDSSRMALLRARSRRPLVKDPIALFAAEWLFLRFDMQVVVMIRHPVAFASSIKRLRWDFDFGWWAIQEDLLRDHLSEFREEIGAFAATEHDHIDQAILLWRCMYTVVDHYRDAHPDWQFVIYERLAEQPAEGFQRLYEALDLRHDAAVAAKIAAYSASTNVKDVPADQLGTTKRDSQAALAAWRKRLTPEEVDRVLEGTADVARRFYPDEPPLFGLDAQST